MSGYSDFATSTAMCIVLLLLDLTEQQTVTVDQGRWTKTALSDLGVRFVGHKAQFHNSSLLSCASFCLINAPCLSFSLHTSTKQCFIFSNRVSFGINMQRESGFTHYWTIYDDCPSSAGYEYVASAHVCYKAVATLDGRLSWGDAHTTCQADGGHLYIANTQAKMDVVTTFIEQHNYQTLQFKLGGNDLFEEGWFLWLDGSPVTTWYTGQPDNRDGLQHCMENTRNHPDYNSDGKCDTQDRYICQRPLS